MDTKISAAVDGLLPVVSECRAQAEAERQPPTALCEAIHESRLTSMSVAPSRGGLGTTLLTAGVLSAVTYALSGNRQIGRRAMPILAVAGLVVGAVVWPV